VFCYQEKAGHLSGSPGNSGGFQLPGGVSDGPFSVKRIEVSCKQAIVLKKANFE
jgi:hypothetical protein